MKDLPTQLAAELSGHQGPVRAVRFNSKRLSRVLIGIVMCTRVLKFKGSTKDHITDIIYDHIKGKDTYGTKQ